MHVAKFEEATRSKFRIEASIANFEQPGFAAICGMCGKINYRVQQFPITSWLRKASIAVRRHPAAQGQP